MDITKLMANARYIVLPTESCKYLMNNIEPQNSHSSNSFAPTALKVDMQGKTIIYIESFFPNPREAHNILFGETGK